ncbi:rhodanese-like domain-containing protein [Iningainema tapete]|uniref:Rhodanese-like domain-containing protein n=1 Tax=Iningainema tapete BLCC-T55 TaxID=2748662 RepID=A0A8J6XP89_9CYAN|nr:rhodanese-like domain-containing protein [Iningainema tapete BLCC-T55]
MRSLTLNLLKLLFKLQFPTIQLVTTRQLAQWLDDAAAPQPLVLDARTVAEYEVSHLKTAQRIDPNLPETEITAMPKDTPIVVYCSVGYRSAKIAQQIQQMGFSRVFNLSGGIFQWANEGKSIYKNGQTTQLVHPYNAKWGKLLKVK